MENRVPYFRTTKPNENDFFKTIFYHTIAGQQVALLELDGLTQSDSAQLRPNKSAPLRCMKDVRFAMVTAASHTCCWLLYLNILIYLILILLVLPFGDNFFWQSSAIPIRSSEDFRCMFRDWCCSHGHVCLNNSLCIDGFSHWNLHFLGIFHCYQHLSTVLLPAPPSGLTQATARGSHGVACGAVVGTGSHSVIVENMGERMLEGVMVSRWFV